MTTMAACWSVVMAVAVPVAMLHAGAASAQPCPDVEVVFARGTAEPPGVGGVGQAFVDALRSRLGDRSLGVYAVNYPATRHFDVSTSAGRDDVSAHIQATASNCPNTRFVLGGHSQGAAVIDMATTAMPDWVADRVAAAALFGSPRNSLSDLLAPGPLPTTGPLYAAKTIDLCARYDLFCARGGWSPRAHNSYVQTGMVDQAASFVADRL
ncbi:cutinase family protein [Mycolicibacterium sp. XJ1819]